MMKADEIIETMEAMRDDAQREILMRFFRTGKGQYGEGDEFLGIKVPGTRAVVKEIGVGELSLDEVHRLLLSPWHEVRLCALLYLVKMAEASVRKRRNSRILEMGEIKDDSSSSLDEIVRFYLDHAECANNWDLVDLTAPRIVGRWLMTETDVPLEEKERIIEGLIQSGNLWRQRIAMVCTWWTSREGNLWYVLRYAEMLLNHPHDLMHKAVGWMLREMGKSRGVMNGKDGMTLLREFLEKHIQQMPRTTLRYAIEKMDATEKSYWMSIPVEKRKR